MSSANTLWSRLRARSHLYCLIFLFSSPVNTLFALQIGHAGHHVPCHPDQHLGPEILALGAQKGQEVSSCRGNETSSFNCKNE